MTVQLPARCARFAPRATARVETLPANSPERQELEAKLAGMRPNLLRLVDLLLDLSPFVEQRGDQHAALWGIMTKAAIYARVFTQGCIHDDEAAGQKQVGLRDQTVRIFQSGPAERPTFSHPFECGICHFVRTGKEIVNCVFCGSRKRNVRTVAAPLWLWFAPGIARWAG